MQARRIYASTTVLRASLLSDFHIQRYCQWYGCSMAYFDKGRRGFGNSSKCREKFGASLCFSSTNFPANIVSVHFVWRFTTNLVSVHRDKRGTETGCVSETASLQFTSLASRKQWGLSGQWGSKALANQTSLGSGPMFGTVRWTYSPNITFSDVLFHVSSDT